MWVQVRLVDLTWNKTCIVRLYLYTLVIRTPVWLFKSLCHDCVCPITMDHHDVLLSLVQWILFLFLSFVLSFFPFVLSFFLSLSLFSFLICFLSYLLSFLIFVISFSSCYFLSPFFSFLTSIFSCLPPFTFLTYLFIFISYFSISLSYSFLILFSSSLFYFDVRITNQSHTCYAIGLYIMNSNDPHQFALYETVTGNLHCIFVFTWYWLLSPKSELQLDPFMQGQCDCIGWPHAQSQPACLTTVWWK